jgi:hypothetical protein
VKQINRLSPYLSRRLREYLLAAGAAEARAFRRSKGQEPPLVEGALFYLVDDLELLGHWDFGAKGRLSKILKDVAGQAPSGMGVPTPVPGEK